MITVIGGGFAGLSAAYFLHRAGKDVTVLEWSRSLGGRAATRNVGYRTLDSGAQRIDLSPLTANPLETEARALMQAVAQERGVMEHVKPFPGPIYRFDGRSIATAQQVELPGWGFIDGGMKAFAEALVAGIPVRTHTRISDLEFEKNACTLRNQRGEKMPAEAVVLALPAPYAHALLQPHASKRKIKKVCDLLNDVHYEPMIGAMFGTTKIGFKQDFSAIFTDDITAPVFWLSQEEKRRNLGVRKNESAFVLQLGAEVSREYVLKTDSETFAAIERIFEEVLDIVLPDVIYGEIQRWPAAFLESSPFSVETVTGADFDVPVHLVGDYIAGQSSIASAFWSGKKIADKIVQADTFQYIASPIREQAQPASEIWTAPIPPARIPRIPRPKPKRKKSKETDSKRRSTGQRDGRSARPSYGRGPRPGGDNRRGFERPSGPGFRDRRSPQGGGRFQERPGFQPRGRSDRGAPSNDRGGYQPRPAQGGYQQGPNRPTGPNRLGGPNRPGVYNPGMNREGGANRESRPNFERPYTRGPGGPRQDDRYRPDNRSGGGYPDRGNQQSRPGPQRSNYPRTGGYQPRSGGGYQQGGGSQQGGQGGYQGGQGGGNRNYDNDRRGEDRRGPGNYSRPSGGYAPRPQSGGAGVPRQGGYDRPRDPNRQDRDYPNRQGGGYGGDRNEGNRGGYNRGGDFNRPGGDPNRERSSDYNRGPRGGVGDNSGPKRPGSVPGRVVYSTSNRPTGPSPEGPDGGNFNRPPSPRQPSESQEGGQDYNARRYDLSLRQEDEERRNLARNVQRRGKPPDAPPNEEGAPGNKE